MIVKESILFTHKAILKEYHMLKPNTTHAPETTPAPKAGMFICITLILTYMSNYMASIACL